MFACAMSRKCRRSARSSELFFCSFLVEGLFVSLDWASAPEEAQSAAQAASASVSFVRIE